MKVDNMFLKINFNMEFDYICLKTCLIKKQCFKNKPLLRAKEIIIGSKNLYPIINIDKIG